MARKRSTTKSVKRKRSRVSKAKKRVRFSVKAKRAVKRRVSRRSTKRTFRVIKGKGDYVDTPGMYTSQSGLSSLPVTEETPIYVDPNYGVVNPPSGTIEEYNAPVAPRVNRLPVDVNISEVQKAFPGWDRSLLEDIQAGRMHLTPGTGKERGQIWAAQGPGYNVPLDRLISNIENMSVYQRYKNSNFVRKANKYVPKGTFATIGGLVGGPLGAYAGSKFASLAGFGAYTVKNNSLMLGEGQSPAYMHQSNSNAIIRHREYIQDIVSSPNVNQFQNQVFPINPGMVGTFPWLSALAQQYEQYRIRGMVFEYKSMYADAIASSAANSTLGYVIMGTNYNAVYPPFINKQQMDNTDYTTSAKPSVSFYHPIECDPASHPTTNLYVRSGAPPSNADLRMYDFGNFQVATGGIASPSVTLGELWCSYEVELIKPISTTAHGLNVLSDHFQLLGLTAGSDVLGADATPVSGSSIGGKITNGNLYSFPPNITDGNYLVVCHWQGTAGPGMVLPTPTLTNCTAMELWNGGASVTAGAGEGAADLSAMLSFVVNINNPIGASPATIEFTGGVLTYTANAVGDLFVTQIDADIIS